MAEIELHLAIEESSHFGGGELYQRKMETPFLPRKGESVVLFPHDPEVPYDGPMVPVREVYWGHDGAVGVDLEHHVIDPSESMERSIMASIRTDFHLHGWYTERDGNLVELLLANGWERA